MSPLPVRGLTLQEKMRLAHVADAQYAQEVFQSNGLAITPEEARRLAFIAFLVCRKDLCEWLDARPRPFVSSDPRRRFMP